MGDIRKRIDTLRERVRSSEEIGDADAKRLETFSNRLDLLAQEYSDHRHEKLLRHGVIIAENCEDGVLDAALEERSAAESIVRWINAEYDNEETNRDYRTALRVIGRRVAEADDSLDVPDDGVPESLSWVPTSTSTNYDPTPDPREMLRWEDDVKPMMDAALNARDRAMAALQFDAGLRGGEFKSLTIGDLQDHEHGLQVTVEGKQGRRTVLLIPSVTEVNQWLASHPAGDDPSAPLWSKLGKAESISDHMIGKALRQLADRVDVTRPVTLTNFRKSSAAFLAARNLNQAHIEDHHGWVRGSSAAARYIAVFGEDTERELAQLHGVADPSDGPDPIGPLECPRCSRETPRDEPVCVWCGQAMDQQAAAELEESESEIQEALASLDPEQAQRVLDLVDALDDPEIQGALAQLD